MRTRSVSPRVVLFFLALNAWTWLVAIICHEVDLGETTIVRKADGTPFTYPNGMGETTWRAYWFCVPLVGNIIGGYASFFAFACLKWGPE